MAPSEVAVRFYEAFARRDAAGMAACYHPGATFEDPAFGRLDRGAACAMWAMLLGRAADLTVTHAVIDETGSSVRVHWEARYTFSRTGRRVCNRITATLLIEDGLIRSHRDHFSFWAWARQAFGPMGFLLGWLPGFRARVQRDARRALATYQAREPGGAC